jgi:P4 family phage/plasmid primase-like protien
MANNKNGTHSLKKETFANFLDFYRVFEKSPEKPYTNTRISGGSYHIPAEVYPAFIDMHYEQNICKSRMDTLTEVQYEEKGAILVDLDLRFPFDFEKRVYEKDHLDDLVFAYLNNLKKIYKFDSKSKFNIYVMEKSAAKHDETKHFMKDGIHLIIGINADRRMQIYLRKKMVDDVSHMWEDLGITNTWEDVFDKGITYGTVNWQLYGCGKVNGEPYKVTYLYEIDGIDLSDMNFRINCVAFNDTMLKDHIHKLSARYTEHPEFSYTPWFMKTLEESGIEIKKKGVATNSAPNTPRALTPRNGGQPYKNTFVPNEEIANAKSKEDIETYVKMFLESLDRTDFRLVEIYEITMALPSNYYESGSYNNWIRVGWALKRTDDRMFVVWVAFSMQCSTYNYMTDTLGLYDRWTKFNDSNTQGLSDRSIVYWLKEADIAKYREIMSKHVSYKLEETLGSVEAFDCELDKIDKKGAGDYDIAVVLYTMFKHDYICTSVKNSTWYKYSEPCWKECDSGTELRQSISNELRAYYVKYYRKISNDASALDSNNPLHAPLIPKYKGYIDKILRIISRLANTNDKKNIMIEAKELFFDKDHKFLQSLDENKKLICFKNGVVDFEKKEFRRGRPEDYISLCTHINYIELNETHNTKVAEIKKFISELFPGDAALEKYMWQYLASTLIGVLPDQTFNMFIGEGQNGKSLLISLMSLVLGDYRQELPLSILIDKQQKIGAVAPELTKLKGARFAVGNEPNKGETINAGRMKALTSGLDQISARAPYMTQLLVYYPQFKMALCTNELMNIRSTDHGTWRRVRVVPFRAKFCDNPVNDDPEHPYQFKINRDLENKIDEWKEVFASMLVNIVFETGGRVTDCDTVLEASKKYRQSQDYIAAFVDEMLTESPTESVKQAELSNVFTEWYHNTQGGGNPAVKDLYTYLDKKYKKDPKTRKYVGIGIRKIQDLRESIVDEDIDEEFDD